MTVKAVTTAQLEQVRKMAREKGIGKDDFQVGLDDGSVAAMLDRLKPSVESARRQTRLLTELMTVPMPGFKRFVVSEYFSKENPAIKFWFWNNFKNNFLEKIEENVSAADLITWLLNQNSLDDPIRRELGPANEETFLAHVYELLKAQPTGEAGPLRVNGLENIFYVRDAHGNFWAVIVYWSSDDLEWNVDAESVTNPNRWDTGRQVVSRKKR